MANPSERFLTTGIPTAEDLRYIETLERRLRHVLDRDGGSWDRAEASALIWALHLVDATRQDGRRVAVGE